MNERLTYRPMEVARMIGVSKTKIYEMLAAKELPSVRFGGALRVPAQGLRERIAEKQAESDPA